MFLQQYVVIIVKFRTLYYTMHKLLITWQSRHDTLLLLIKHVRTCHDTLHL